MNIPVNSQAIILCTLFALLTALAIGAVLRPLVRRGRKTEGSHELAIYRDQLAEIENDLERGLIAPDEAEGARLEVSRRLIAAGRAVEEGGADNPVRRKLVALGIIALVPFISLVLYFSEGSPQLPDAPFEARVNVPADQLPLEGLVARIEQQLMKAPEDRRALTVIGPAYMQLRRYDDAANTYRTLLALEGKKAELYISLGEALAAAQGGLVQSDARQAFAAAAQLEPNNPRAEYYLGLAELQAGDKPAAIKRWKALLATAKPDAPWRQGLEAAIAEASAAPVAGAQAPGPDAQAMAAAQDMSPQDRQQMIEGMVGRLADRLAKNPKDLDGWLRLARAWQVLGQKDKAAEAIAKARTAFSGDRDALARLDEAEKSLN